MSSNIPTATNTKNDSDRTESHGKIVHRQATALGSDFVPGNWDVIMGRGKQAYNHQGNKNLRLLIEKTHSDYAKAITKHERSTIVTDVMNLVRSKGNGFVRQGEGQWWEVGDYLAREKIGQHLRESLGGKYRSSAASKKRLRRATSAKVMDNVEQVVTSNPVVARTLSQLKHQVPHSFLQSDEEILQRFTTANMIMLHSMKQDASLAERYVAATSNTGLGGENSDVAQDEDAKPSSKK